MAQITSLPKDLSILNQALRDLNTAKQDIADLQQGSGVVSYSPTLVALTGAYTTASATGRYFRNGPMIYLTLNLTFTTVNTGTYPVVSLPVVSNGQFYAFTGVEVATNGLAWTGEVPFGGNGLMVLRRYDNTASPANGSRIIVSGFYEAAN